MAQPTRRAAQHVSFVRKDAQGTEWELHVRTRDTRFVFRVADAFTAALVVLEQIEEDGLNEGAELNDGDDFLTSTAQAEWKRVCADEDGEEHVFDPFDRPPGAF